MASIRWSEEELAKYRANMQRLAGADIPVKIKAEKRSKYNNVKTAVDGRTFDSKIEAQRFLELRRMEDAGLIAELKCQVSFELVPSVSIGGKKTRPMRYIADFTYTQDGKGVIEDVKGKRTDVYRIKRILMKFMLGVEVHEYTRRKPS